MKHLLPLTIDSAIGLWIAWNFLSVVPAMHTLNNRKNISDPSPEDTNPAPSARPLLAGPSAFSLPLQGCLLAASKASWLIHLGVWALARKPQHTGSFPVLRELLSCWGSHPYGAPAPTAPWPRAWHPAQLPAFAAKLAHLHGLAGSSGCG